ncbi:hypothetical protein D6C97_07351 [Aureobasidium pullulans]|nr:hypothetical protein D6C97_07351 [Aureobasidium pullulans]
MVSTKLLGSFIAYALASQALNFRIKAAEHSFFSGQPQLAPGAAMSADIMTSGWEDCPDVLSRSVGASSIFRDGPTCGIFRANGDPTDSVPLEGERYAFLHDAETCLVRPRILSCVASMMVTVKRGVGFVPDGLEGSFDSVVCGLAFGSIPT